MSLWKIALRSVQFRFLSSVLTAFSISLGVALIVTVLVIHGVLDSSFKRGSQGYDYIISGKGSPLDVVLGVVFYLNQPLGGVSDDYLQKFRRGEYSHLVQDAIPLTIGHHFRGSTIVGTSPEFFAALRFMGDKKYECSSGNFFKGTETFSAVLGSRAQKKTGLKVGETFLPENMPNPDGSIDDDHDHDQPFTVVGILEPTGTPNDNVIFVNIDGFYDMHQTHDSNTKKHKKQYSAILLVIKKNPIKPEGIAIDPNSPDFDPTAAMQDRAYVNIHATELPDTLDKTPDIQAVSPIREIAKLLENIVGNIQLVLIFMAVMVVIVAGIGMMVSIYNSMNERKQEIAVMRALGARRFTVMSIILLESILLSLGGGLIGVLIGHAMIGGVGPWISQNTGVVVHALNFHVTEFYLIPGLIILASIVGFLPAIVAYKQDVATSLAP
ncbi:MAG: ABC transporter permease [Planctomycetaceae bacterium]|jgi:putative ABC transport system permease protein|nr:ABC transporter permease [Planctomycetaceae bacterium]